MIIQRVRHANGSDGLRRHGCSTFVLHVPFLHILNRLDQEKRCESQKRNGGENHSGQFGVEVKSDAKATRHTEATLNELRKFLRHSRLEVVHSCPRERREFPGLFAFKKVNILRQHRSHKRSSHIPRRARRPPRREPVSERQAQPQRHRYDLHRDHRVVNLRSHVPYRRRI